MLLRTATSLTLAALAASCTGQLPGSFRFKQQEQAFSTSQQFDTKIDMLWVVDNSASMDVAQQKLRNGFSGFAQKYMKPTWDIRVAVITSDVYLANASFNTYLNTVIPGTVNYSSAHINSRLGTWVNPAWNPTLLNTATGLFPNGIKYKELVPAWNGNYSRLLPGKHDGPNPGICFELLPYFMGGATDCEIRDDQNAYNGTANCLNPGSGESSLSQCVNTLQNDTVRSGKAIIETMPPSGTPGNQAWIDQLIDDFTINITTGSVGHGSERGLASVLQLLSDNEPTATALFRPGSVRGIVFVADEEDQSMTMPSSPPAGFSPFSNYKCDQASLVSMNGAGPITGNNGYCCNVLANNCNFGYNGTSCTQKTVDSYTYTPSLCADPAQLIPVSTVKSTIDTFFQTLDGDSSANPNYFVVSIVPLTGATIQSMQADRDAQDLALGQLKTHAVDRGDRYIELGNQVGNGSMSLDIGTSDYSPILDAIGSALIQKKGTFTLDREPTGEEDMIVKIKKADGTETQVPYDKFVVSGKTLTITDVDFLLSLDSTDQIIINYQPNGAY